MFNWILRLFYKSRRLKDFQTPRTCVTCRWHKPGYLSDPAFATCDAPQNRELDSRAAARKLVDPKAKDPDYTLKCSYCETLRARNDSDRCGARGQWWESTRE